MKARTTDKMVEALRARTRELRDEEYDVRARTEEITDTIQDYLQAIADNHEAWSELERAQGDLAERFTDGEITTLP